MLALGWSVIVLSVLTVALMYWLIRRIPASRVASLFYLVPATTAMFAWLMFDERLDAFRSSAWCCARRRVFMVNYSSHPP